MNCRLLGRGFAIYPYQRAQDPILAHLGDCNRWAVHSDKAHQAEPKVCSPWDATRPKGPPRCPHRCEFCLTNYGEDTETAVRRTGSTCMGAAARAVGSTPVRADEQSRRRSDSGQRERRAPGLSLSDNIPHARHMPCPGHLPLQLRRIAARRRHHPRQQKKKSFQFQNFSSHDFQTFQVKNQL